MSGLLGVFLVGATAQASGWIAVDENGQCRPTHPPRHRIEVVRDSFKKREDLAAVEDAIRDRARAALEQSACADRTPAQCNAIQAQVGLDVAVDLDKRVVCGAALVASGVVADPDGQQAHAARVEAAARQLAGALKGAAVGLVAVQWDSGCGAGEAGARLASGLRAGLARAGVSVTDGQGDRVVARLAPGDPVKVEVWRYAAAEAGALVAGFELSTDWLGLYGVTGDQCHDSAALGLDAGRRTGSGGLSVSLDLSSEGPLCPGEQVEVSLRPSGAAQVQVWSVGRTGEAWLTWSSREGSGGPLDRRVALTLEAAHVPSLGEELLVVVAAPRDVALPGAQAGCRLASLAALPREAAVAAVPFSVLPAGRGRCAAAAAAPGVSWADYQSAPVCQ